MGSQGALSWLRVGRVRGPVGAAWARWDRWRLVDGKLGGEELFTRMRWSPKYVIAHLAIEVHVYVFADVGLSLFF
mgnify:CR=1 FL=1